MQPNFRYFPQNQDKWKYTPGGISMQPNNGKPPHQMFGHNQHPSHLQNHLNPNVLNPLNQPVQMIPSGTFDHVPQSVNVNGVGVKTNEQLVYFSGQHSGVMQPHQYQTRNPAAVSRTTFLYYIFHFIHISHL